MAEIRASFHGNYNYPNPPLRALEESIIQHMKAYGFTDVTVEIEDAARIVAAMNREVR